MSLHEIKQVSLMDVPAQLRRLADAVEQRKIPTVIVVCGYDGGYVSVRGFGERSDGLSASGWLMRGLTMLNEGCDANVSNLLPEPPDAG